MIARESHFRERCQRVHQGDEIRRLGAARLELLGDFLDEGVPLAAPRTSARPPDRLMGALLANVECLELGHHTWC